MDIGQQARSLKEFLVLRDNHPAFAKVRERGNIGIPCFVKEDGSVIISLKHYDASLLETDVDVVARSEGSLENRSEYVTDQTGGQEYASGAACSLDGTGC